MGRGYLKRLAWMLAASVAMQIMQVGGVMAFAADITPCIEMGVFKNSYAGPESGENGNEGDGEDEGGGGSGNEGGE